jgi:ribose-phosphate pyrophosphokinase
MIKLYKNNIEIPFKQWKFPGGEVGVQLVDEPSYPSMYVVEMLFEGSDDIIAFLNVCDALKESGVCKESIAGKIPYVPSARQDRVCSKGESKSLEIFIQMLSYAYCSEYEVHDVHSNVTLELMSRYGIDFYETEQWQCAEDLPKFDVLIAPDKGAENKAKEHNQVKYSDTSLVHLSKTRKDGKVVYDDYPFDTIKGNVCVVDDIIDNGGTFLALGEMLKKTQPNITSLNLYATHGLMRNGTLELKKFYDTIYVSNLMNKSIVDEVTVI